VELRDMTLADAVSVTASMRQVDADCLDAVAEGISPDQFAINLHQQTGAAWTLTQDGEPIAVGGVKLPVSWAGVVWFVCTDRMSPSAWKKLLRHGRIVLGNASKQLRRVECHVLGTWAEARLFAEREGFELEGVRQNAGRDGQDILTYVYRESA
jgi:hypothetical protein